MEMNKQSTAGKLAKRVEWLAALFRGVSLGLYCIGILLPAIGTWLWGNTFGYACFSLIGVAVLFSLGYGYLLSILREYEQNNCSDQKEFSGVLVKNIREEDKKENESMYTYFVSFYFEEKTGGTGFGNNDRVDMINPIASKEVADVEAALKKKYDYSNVVLLNWILLEDHKVKSNENIHPLEFEGGKEASDDS